jgi:hypothetical protein
MPSPGAHVKNAMVHERAVVGVWVVVLMSLVLRRRCRHHRGRKLHNAADQHELKF